jgi:hypothetical protein
MTNKREPAAPTALRLARSSGLIAAAVIGGSISIVANGAKTALTNYTPEAVEWVAYAGIAAFPFFVLTLARMRHWRPWAMGGAVTLLVWGAYLAYGIPQLRDGRGIDMGLGFAVASSPVWITIVSVLTGVLGRRPT